MPIKIDPQAFVPIYEQVKSEIRRLAAIGVVRAHDPLPSIRELAAEALINPNTVARAYRELEQEGLIYTQKGRGSFLAARRAQDPDRVLEGHLNRKLDEAIADVRKFGLSGPEIRRRFETRLRRAEESDRKGGSNG